MAFNKTPIIAAMARPVKVMLVPAIWKVSPEEKPSPHTKMVAAIIKFLVCEINFVFYDVADTDGGNHTVENKADTADDSCRKGTVIPANFGMKLKTTA